MAKDLDTRVQQSWDDFVKDYNLVLNFGMDALQDKLNAQAKAQGQTYRFSNQDIKEILPSLEQKIELTLVKSLGLVRQMVEQLQTPRAGKAFELTPENVARSNGPQTRYEQAPWAGKFDIAADANINHLQDAFNKINNESNPQNKDALLMKFKMTLRNDAKNRLEQKLSLANKLDYKPSAPKPKRPGEF